MSFLASETTSDCGTRAFNVIARELPRANALGQVANLVDLLPSIESEPRLSNREAAEAFKVVSFLAHSYIWSSPTGLDVIPSGLALTWVRLANSCGLPPVLTYSSYVLDNWECSPAGEQVPSLTFTGSQDELWFIRVHQRIEQAGSDIRSLAEVHREPTRSGQESHLDLGRIAECLEDMCAEARKMPERCDPYIYFNRIRRFLYGWKWNPLFGNRTMTYEGVHKHDLPEEGQYSGETGAQSPLVHLVDELLGVQHTEPFKGYAKAMRAYMYANHRDVIYGMTEVRPLEFATGDGIDANQYRRALEALIEFRTIHLEFAKTYIVSQATRHSGQDAAGTGGSEILAVLSSARNAVEQRLGDV